MTEVGALARVEPRSAYLRRAKRLLPQDPELWYLSGIQELADGQPEEAAASWRQCLELSDTYLVAILNRGRRGLGCRRLLVRVLPDNPELLARAAVHLFPDPSADPEQTPFLKRALLLLEKSFAPRTAKEHYLKARFHRSLGQFPEAVAAYEAALLREPRREAWRLELVRLLLDQGQVSRARRELAGIRWRHPTPREVRELWHQAGGRDGLGP